MKRKFSAPNLQACLSQAAKELGIEESAIIYEITSEKKGFFKKEIEIEVRIPHGDLDGKVEVVNGEIMVKDPHEGGRPATISPAQGIGIRVNDIDVKGQKPLRANDKIEWYSCDVEAVRDIEVRVSQDRVSGYVKVILENAKEYIIKDSQEMTDLVVGSVEEIKEVPERIAPKDVIKAMKKYNITTGVIIENINSVNELQNGEEILIAQGKALINGEDDKLILNYNDNKIPFKDSKGNVDYKSIGHVDTIVAGDVICELIRGKNEEDGIDVYGKVIKSEKTKRINIIAGKGCRQEGDKIIAALSGKPMKKGYTFSIEPIYVVNGNVDLATGDVKYDGNVEILGEVTEGMKVESGSSVVIHQGASGANIKADKSITISGNIMTSNVSSGSDEVYQNKIFCVLNELNAIISELGTMTKQIFEGKILGENVKVGEVCKVLIERRFRKLKLAIEEYQKLVKIKYGVENELGEKLKSMFQGFGPLSIEDCSQISDVSSELENQISALNVDIENQSDMVLSYIQDSKIVCHGDIFINGKGEYVSEITSSGSVYFSDNSVARGGYIKANDSIVCNLVGSSGRVRTTLHVEKHGKIVIKKAYSNTKLVIGKCEYIIEVDSTDLEAKIGEKGELVVEKLKM